MKTKLIVMLVVISAMLAVTFFYGHQQKDINKNKSHFRTKFHNKTIENCIHDFEYWHEIQSQEVDMAFESYFTGSHLGGEKETALILELIDRGGFLGVVAEAHEKWEVLEYLRKDYSLEEIGSGKAYKEYKPTAHTEARFKEIRLYQFWYKQLFDEDPPAMIAFLFVHPMLKIIAQDIYHVEIDAELMDMLVHELDKYEGVIRSENCSREDVENCIKFFEKTGYDYGDQKNLFLKRGLDFLDEFNKVN